MLKIADFVNFGHKYPVHRFFANMRFVAKNSKYCQSRIGRGRGELMPLSSMNQKCPYSLHYITTQETTQAQKFALDK